MEIRKFYPNTSEIDTWMEEIWEAAKNLEVTVTHEPVPETLTGPFQVFPNNVYLRFTEPDGSYFYAVYQPALSGPAPLVVHVPGYGSEVSIHPEIQAQGFSVLHVQPMGYMNPVERNLEKWDKNSDSWPVLPDTVRTFGKGGYKTFLTQCAAAILYTWTLPGVLPDRVSFFGTSQGGGCSLLLGSLFAGKGCRCVAADEPFLTNYEVADFRGAYGILNHAIGQLKEQGLLEKGLHSLGLVDTINHAYRLQMPVMITSGTIDDVCPPESIAPLFDLLPGTKCYMSTKGMAHGHNMEFTTMAAAWLRMHA